MKSPIITLSIFSETNVMNIKMIDLNTENLAFSGNHFTVKCLKPRP